MILDFFPFLHARIATNLHRCITLRTYTRVNNNASSIAKPD